MRALLQFLRCLIGRHAWKSYGSNVTDQSGGTITLIWWECDKCGESKLKCIFGNRK